MLQARSNTIGQGRETLISFLILSFLFTSPQITRRIRRTLIKTTVNEAEAERKTWTKFGAEKNRPSGPHSSTTTIGENVQLKLSAGNKKVSRDRSG